MGVSAECPFVLDENPWVLFIHIEFDFWRVTGGPIQKVF